MKHKCKLRVDHYLWVFPGGYFFCPYCGVKLEPPDAEASVTDRLRWDAEYQTVLNDTCRAAMWRELARLERLILGKDKEPPEKIEVSRNQLVDAAIELGRAQDLLAFNNQSGRISAEGHLNDAYKMLRSLLND